MKKFLIIMISLLFASPVLHACAIYGIWELDSESQYLSMEFREEGKITIKQGPIGGTMVSPKASWRCEGGILSIYGEDNSIFKQLTDIRMMGGIISATNKNGVSESYLYYMTPDQ